MARDISGLRRGGPGRPRGVPNKATSAVRDLCQRLVTDPDYQAKLELAWRARELPPQLEAMIWHYAYGRPSASIETTDRGPSLAEIIAGTFRDSTDADTET
jgi:hypothetical protein